eukprot:TRINITY_DN29556_c0_g1_i1.p1 TRINITY_DN29556_c0_g1~~TRINITY_DN29556_c0_g1_i1.p1  ORF type:complete len:107 (-),score=30.52 TRINITY_DN29556_c0_g1_i1:50-370(-)
MNERGKPSGTAIVQLKTYVDVENALKFHKQKLGLRHVDVISLTAKVEEETTAKIEEDTTAKVEEGTTKCDEQTTTNVKKETTTILDTTAKVGEESKAVEGSAQNVY